MVLLLNETRARSLVSLVENTLLISHPPMIVLSWHVAVSLTHEPASGLSLALNARSGPTHQAMTAQITAVRIQFRMMVALLGPGR